MTPGVILLAIITVAIVTIDWRFRQLVGYVRRLAPGCTCPLEGRASSTCPAHKTYVPRGVEPTWYPPTPRLVAACQCGSREATSAEYPDGRPAWQCLRCSTLRPRSPAPPPDSTSPYYVPPGRNE